MICSNFKKKKKFNSFLVWISVNNSKQKELIETIYANILISMVLKQHFVVSGNLSKQPAVKFVKKRISGKLTNADFIMENSFLLGVIKI